jgi:hypothetical protein
LDASASALRAGYEARRRDAPRTLEGRWKLALWCERHGLPIEALAHFAEVIRLAPEHEAARKRLGFKRVGRFWLTQDQLDDARAEQVAQERASKTWRPQFARWLDDLGSKNAEVAAKAEVNYLKVTDPRSVPELVRSLGAADLGRQRLLVSVLGQIDSVGASRVLASIAVSSFSPEIRRMAAETLRNRDAREFADRLVVLVRKPIEYEVSHVNGPGTVGELYVKGERYDVRRLYEAPTAPPPMEQSGFVPVLSRADFFNQYLLDIMRFDQSLRPNPRATQLARDIAANPAGAVQAISREVRAAQSQPPLVSDYNSAFLSFANRVGWDSTGIVFATPDIEARGFLAAQRNWERARQAAQTAQARLNADIALIDAHNAEVERTNALVLPVLQAVSGLTAGAEPGLWQDWWLANLGLREAQSLADRPVFEERVAIDVPFEPVQFRVSAILMSCFGEGTLVHTESGPRAIESVQVGDLVLSQDPSTGALGYQPVVAIHHNPPSETFEVRLDTGESIVSSAFHRFWVARKGWVMARDLKPSDVIRTLGGTCRVVSNETGKTQPVFNLDVAGWATFFAGTSAALVHDQTIPILQGEPPFDAVTTTVLEQ